MNTGATSLGNLFKQSIDDIRLQDSYQEIKLGCNSNEPTNHCKNCSYKELVPILNEIGV